MPDGSFLVVEIERRTVTRIAADGALSVVSQTGGGPNGLAIGPGGAGFVTNNGGFEFHIDENGIRPTVQARDYDGGRLERVDLASGRVEILYRETGSGFSLPAQRPGHRPRRRHLVHRSRQAGRARDSTMAASITPSPTARASRRWRSRC